MRDAFRLAIGTLTAVRVAPPASIEPPVPGRAMALAPLVGLIPGITAAAAAGIALEIGLGPAVAAVIVVGLFALTTRGLHLDGLADTADGLAASYDRGRALEVMRRGDTGPNGLAAVVLVLLLQVAALTQVLGAGDATGRGVTVVVAVAVVGRVAIPLACVQGVPSARPEGLGATVAGSVRPVVGVLVVLVTAGLAAALGSLSELPWYAGPLATLAAVLAVAALLHRAVTRFGGITGDVLGAAVEIATAAALLTLAAAS